jgi:cysteine desulfuration protein SufE
MHPQYKDGRIYFTADSDALITKGLVAMVVKVLSGHTPKEIAEADVYFVDRIGLRSHLSPTRSNGLLSMLKQMKIYAVAFQAQSLQN